MVVGWTPYLHLAVFGLKIQLTSQDEVEFASVWTWFQVWISPDVTPGSSWTGFGSRYKNEQNHQESTEMHLRSSPQDFQLWFGLSEACLKQKKVESEESVVVFHICKHQTFCGVNKSEKWQWFLLKWLQSSSPKMVILQNIALPLNLRRCSNIETQPSPSGSLMKKNES